MKIRVPLVVVLAAVSCGGGQATIYQPLASDRWRIPSVDDASAYLPVDAGREATSDPSEGRLDAGAVGDRGNGDASNPDIVVARMRHDFRSCYNRGIARDRNMQGSVRITAKIGAGGEVLSAIPSGGDGLDEEMISCLVRRVQSATFPAPPGGEATVVIPVKFATPR